MFVLAAERRRAMTVRGCRRSRIAHGRWTRLCSF